MSRTRLGCRYFAVLPCPPFPPVLPCVQFARQPQCRSAAGVGPPLNVSR